MEYSAREQATNDDTVDDKDDEEEEEDGEERNSQDWCTKLVQNITVSIRTDGEQRVKHRHEYVRRFYYSQNFVGRIPYVFQSRLCLCSGLLTYCFC